MALNHYSGALHRVYSTGTRKWQSAAQFDGCCASCINYIVNHEVATRGTYRPGIIRLSAAY